MTLTEFVGGDPLAFAATAAGVALLVPAAGIAALQVRALVRQFGKAGAR